MELKYDMFEEDIELIGNRLENVDELDEQGIRKLAVNFFNGCWDFIDIENRSAEEEKQMIEAALLSGYYWRCIGEPLHFARSDWQISRAFVLAGKGEEALRNAESSLKLCLDHDIDDFDLCFGYESVARAYKVLGDEENCGKYKELAVKALDGIKKKGDRDYCKSEIDSI